MAGENAVCRACQRRHQLDRRVRLDPGDACLVGKGRAGPRQPVFLVGRWVPASEWAERLPSPPACR